MPSSQHQEIKEYLEIEKANVNFIEKYFLRYSFYINYI